jgi:predicted nuclease of predicted toxin-antitoxin system
MTTKVLVDMNLSPEWVPLLIGCGFEAIHWSTVGNPRARRHYGVGTSAQICRIHA